MLESKREKLDFGKNRSISINIFLAGFPKGKVRGSMREKINR